VKDTVTVYGSIPAGADGDRLVVLCSEGIYDLATSGQGVVRISLVTGGIVGSLLRGVFIRRRVRRGMSLVPAGEQPRAMLQGIFERQKGSRFFQREEVTDLRIVGKKGFEFVHNGKKHSYTAYGMAGTREKLGVDLESTIGLYHKAGG